jgi:hypothetical protein
MTVDHASDSAEMMRLLNRQREDRVRRSALQAKIGETVAVTRVQEQLLVPLMPPVSSLLDIRV